MDSAKKKKKKKKKNRQTHKQTNKIWRIYWQMRLLSLWEEKGMLQTQKWQNLKTYYYANKFLNSTIEIPFQSSSNLFSCVIYTLFIACKKIPSKIWRLEKISSGFKVNLNIVRG